MLSVFHPRSSEGVLTLGQPTILRSRAARLQRITGQYYRASMDEQKPLVIKDLLKTSLSRPPILLVREPIVLILSIYMAIIYGTLYMLFSAFPQVYQVARGWSPGKPTASSVTPSNCSSLRLGVGGLAFIPVAIGILIGVAYIIAYENPRYVKVAKENGGRAPPEARLPPAILGSVALVIGLAWFSASCAPSTHWIVSMLGSVPFGFGMCLVFLALMNYL